MAPTISVDEWMAELDTLDALAARDVGNAFTVAEVAAETGRGVKWVREKIGQGVAAGLVAFAGHKASRRIDGKPCFVPAYRVVKKGKK